MGAPTSEFDVGFEPRLGRSVSIDHAAMLLRVSRRTIYNRIRDGRLKTIRTIGGSQRVLIDSLQVHVLTGGAPPTGPQTTDLRDDHGVETSW